jgi:hypothetical protein
MFFFHSNFKLFIWGNPLFNKDLMVVLGGENGYWVLGVGVELFSYKLKSSMLNVLIGDNV